MMLRLFRVNSLYFLGELKELADSVASERADAQHRGDLYTAVNFATTTGLAAHVAAGDPDRARRFLPPRARPLGAIARRRAPSL